MDEDEEGLRERVERLEKIVAELSERIAELERRRDYEDTLAMERKDRGY